jgi:hypothetical protein
MEGEIKMKPLKPKKAIEGVSRAKMYIKRDLDLFVGYPGPDGEWISLLEGKEPEILSLDGKHIHNAIFTINKLVRDFPIALPKIVGDVSKWSNRYKSLIEVIKSSIHFESPLPESLIDLNQENGEGERKLFKKLIKDNPSLKYVINSFSWITFLEPASFKDALSWLANHVEKIDLIHKNLSPVESLNTIIKLWRLSNDVGEKRVETIALWLSNPEIYNVPMERGYSHAYQIHAALGRKRTDSTPPIPKARFGKDIVQWISWLSLQDGRTVKRAIDLFDLVCDIGLVEGWKQWWKSLNVLIKEAEKIPRPLTKSDPLNARLNSIRDEIKSTGENAPPSISSKLLFSLIIKWSEENKTNDFREIFKALSVLPVTFDNVPVRLAFLNYWNNLFEENDPSKKRVILSIMKEFSRYIKGHSDFSGAIKLWEKVLDSWKADHDPGRYIFTIDEEILEEEIDAEKEICRLYDLFREFYLDKSIGQIEEDEKRNIVLLFKLLDKEHVREAFLELRKYGLSCNYLWSELLRLAVEITQKSYEAFGIVVKILFNSSERYSDISRVIKPIIHICANSEYEPFLLGFITGGQIKKICDISLKAGLMEYLGEKEALSLPAPILKETEWSLRYPEELQEDLLKLAASDRNAEATAKRILSEDFPDKDRLLKEIAGLTNIIEKGGYNEGGLKKRVEALEKRLAENQPSIGKLRLKNLANKLKHAAMMGLVKRWDEEIDAKFKAFMKDYLNRKEFPEWLERKNVLETILSTAELEMPYQKIVQKILLRRASDLPWDFRDEAQNASFIERLGAANINMIPWLDGEDKLVIKPANGEELTISIERDPIEVFSMGLHFKTCLSPGGVNFFSVFSNIIDINKQVVYGKTRNGSVKARALIALTDEGGILTFHPYCNDANIDFHNVLKEFAGKLAQNMRTVVLPSGSVSRLIAPDWYDDGPYDLAEKFPFVLDGSDFRKRMMEMDTPELLRAMDKEVEPIGLNELTIPFFVFLPELRESKKLIDALFPSILRLKNLPSDVLLRYSEALWETESLQMLEMLVPRMIEHMLSICGTYYYWAIKDWMELLLKISPSKVLFVLRKTRPKGVHLWEDDDGERIAAAGTAYLRLNRKKQAADLFRLCLERDTEKSIRNSVPGSLRNLNHSDFINLQIKNESSQVKISQ